MKTYRVYIGVLVLFALVMPALGLSLGKIIAQDDLLLKKYEPTTREFLKMELGSRSVYWSPRTIGDAVVEGDGMLYQIDTGSGALIASRNAMRSGLPDDLSSFAIIDPASLPVQAALSSRLYFISPESEIYRLTTPTNGPCWVVWSQGPDGKIITIFDAVSGDQVGYGIAPPYDAYSMGGPDHGSVATPNCGEYYYNPYATNARDGFNDMGYSTLVADRPDRNGVESQIESSSIALFYELDHGGSYSYLNKNCDASNNYVPEHIFATDIEDWMDGFTKMPFTFLGSCEGMCHTDDNSFSYEFRKGSTENTVTVGYCHMDWSGGAGEGYDCSTCWGQAINWQTKLFDYLQAGDTAKSAFDKALADVGVCGDGSSCMRFLGDEDMKFVPVVIRGSLPTAKAGPDQTVEQTSFAGTPVTLDGSGSTEPNAGATLTYTWTWAGGSATGVKPTASFPLGTTEVTLVVEDGFSAPEDLADRTDTVLIKVVDTTPPVFTSVPADVTVEQVTAAGTVVSLTATATDICDASPTVTSNAPAIFPLGETTVTFTATDDSGNKATATMKVTVVDTTPPSVAAVNDITVEQATAAGTEVTLSALVSDICDADPDVTWSHGPTAVFPLGITTVTVTATDESGHTASDTVVVTVVDTTPPTIGVTVSPDTLWSPNHKMADIVATVKATDICDAAPDIALVSITSNEPDDAVGMGDGNTVNDIQGATLGGPDYAFQLRAERDGAGTGRVYTITYSATDNSGNRAMASATVKVPHNGQK